VLFEDVETARPFFAPIRRFRVNVAWVALAGGLAGLVLEVVR
jgi:hypothetical protein